MKKMNKVSALLMFALPLAFLSGCVVNPGQPNTRMEVGGSVVNGDLNSFYFSMSEYYRVPQRDVIYIHERRIPDYDIPVVLFISQRARVSPSVIVNLRLSGNSWMDISLRYGIGPDVYYVPVQNVYGAPYGRAYGYYQNRNRNEWNRIRLADDDVVNMVNLRFISERYGYPPEEVMRMRSSGRNFVTIHDEARRSKGSGDYRQQDRKESREPVIKQERREQEYRQQDQRRDAREPVMQPERRDQEYRQQDRREMREPVMQQERQERDYRQQDRRDTHEPVMQQGRQQKEMRQQDRQETRETVKQQDKQKKETRQKGRNNDEGDTDKQDKKGKGAFRGTDEERGR
ncbi:hypothetical protein [Sulfurirhabdus autotrophica]|uniref:Lipoprotein n=1 Tax=Sulfurirhabdus autotrophica TaxID=1706046 RepID=A0A4R3YDX7_9PROT|nr:hypothetical protein [Sulfurirhabdus autotrophica]TCV89044.1 hypothetical protein EDC63_103116 [Sulfurirhabdus autotrophica]